MVCSNSNYGNKTICISQMIHEVSFPLPLWLVSAATSWGLHNHSKTRKQRNFFFMGFILRMCLGIPYLMEGCGFVSLLLQTHRLACLTRISGSEWIGWNRHIADSFPCVSEASVFSFVKSTFYDQTAEGHNLPFPLPNTPNRSNFSWMKVKYLQNSNYNSVISKLNTNWIACA